MDIENWRIFYFFLATRSRWQGSGRKEKREKLGYLAAAEDDATAEDGRKNTKKKSAKLTKTEFCTQRQTQERKRRERERERETILRRSCLS
jgi:hypothetical protein